MNALAKRVICGLLSTAMVAVCATSLTACKEDNTQNALTAVFRLTGVSSFNAQFTAMSIAIIAVSFFAFAYFASRKIKSVQIKKLAIE